ncbi:hypothetical protein NDU88_004791 [Pleurodeles waltl]|uniref:Uncharacterized protein n=1 Tax=Pleurodeles waltl TaxID=8319 RepID=A0AAV7NKU0_PLEWA|nr:hypothetical protein NDU88_004791 [Pleurodeles waltl]
MGAWLGLPANGSHSVRLCPAGAFILPFLPSAAGAGWGSPRRGRPRCGCGGPEHRRFPCGTGGCSAVSQAVLGLEPTLLLYRRSGLDLGAPADDCGGLAPFCSTRRGVSRSRLGPRSALSGGLLAGPVRWVDRPADPADDVVGWLAAWWGRRGCAVAPLFPLCLPGEEGAGAALLSWALEDIVGGDCTLVTLLAWFILVVLPPGRKIGLAARGVRVGLACCRPCAAVCCGDFETTPGFTDHRS